ncbi:polysaccharide deacetylase [Paramecium bursaria Chlorella virus NE-JV-1]|nr:polysaccharide deacetylase [Paramecium bursaria Chlorella virus NE-JV-1]
MMRIIAFFALVAVAAGCSLPNCYDPGSKMPLPINEVPQFVLLSHDDEINVNTFDAFQKVGICDSKITFFLMWSKIDCRYVRAFYDAGHEIALHTVNHLHLTGVPLDDLAYEMLGVRELVHEKCGIPMEAMIGFRAPFLEVNEHTRKVLYDDKNILYESSYNTDAPMVPFTLDSGLVKNSSVASESYPGLWQIPLNSISNAMHKATYSMDPGRISQDQTESPATGSKFIPANDMRDLLIQNFNEHRENRLPFSVNFHTPWMNADGYAAALGKFLDYTRRFDDVYFITYTELIEWMKNPVPVSKMPKQSRSCVPIVVPAETFWNKYGDLILVVSIVVGPVFTLSFGTLIAHVFFLIALKNPV